MEKKKNTRKIIGVIVDVIIWVFVILCVGVSIVAVSASTNAKNVPTVGGTCFLNVKTDSMNAAKPADVPAGKPSGFSAGTLLLSKYIAEDESAVDALEVGDIITFEMRLDSSNTVDYNTHRIIAVERNENGALLSVTTKGDNNDLVDGGQVSRGTIIAVFTGSKIPALQGAGLLEHPGGLRRVHPAAADPVLHLSGGEVRDGLYVREEHRQEGHLRCR